MAGGGPRSEAREVRSNSVFRPDLLLKLADTCDVGREITRPGIWLLAVVKGFWLRHPHWNPDHRRDTVRLWL